MQVLLSGVHRALTASEIKPILRTQESDTSPLGSELNQLYLSSGNTRSLGNHQINHAEGLEQAFRDEQDGSGLVSYRICTTHAHGCVSECGTGAYL